MTAAGTDGRTEILIRWIFKIIADNIRYLPQTIAIARGDLKRQHNSSDLGFFWAVMKPLMYLLMFYFAISLGFKNAKNIDGSYCPYFIWLAAGIVQWQFISGLLVGGANSFYRRRTLIKHTKFPLLTAPMISICSKIKVYFITILILMALALAMGVKPSIYWLQIPIYVAFTLMFLYVWVLMTSLMNVMSSDIVEFIKTIRSAFFWLSGILFNVKGRGSRVFTYNPICYLAQGFRNVFAYHVWVWDERRLLFNFAVVMVILTTITFLLYKRLEKRLPEML